MFGLVLKTVISGLQNDCSLDCVKKKYKQKIFTAAAAAKSLQLCPTLCNPIDGSPPGSSVLGTLQARTLEWVAISFCNACMHAKSLQSCPTLSNPMDCSLPGSCIHGIFQARVLEWGAIASSASERLRPVKSRRLFQLLTPNSSLLTKNPPPSN